MRKASRSSFNDRCDMTNIRIIFTNQNLLTKDKAYVKS